MEIEEVIEKFRYGTPLNYQTVIRKLQHDKITDVAITRKEYIDTILNYIDKLQKELKDSINARFELQRRIDKLQKENKYLREREEYLEKRRSDIINKFQNEVTDTTIPKNKIKEALGDKSIPDEMILTYIETLVSENNRLEDIEDRKVQIEYNNVFNKGVKSVEDKIRTKIKELEQDQVLYETRQVLKELLGDDE